MNEFNFRWALMVLCLLIFGMAFAVLLWSAWRHHRRGAIGAGQFPRFAGHRGCLDDCALIIVLQLVWPTVRISGALKPLIGSAGAAVWGFPL